MPIHYFDQRWVRRVLIVAFLTGAVCCLFPPGGALFQWWRGQARWVALGYVLLGLLFMMLDKRRLMFVCFGCAGAISFYFTDRSS